MRLPRKTPTKNKHFFVLSQRHTAGFLPNATHHTLGSALLINWQKRWEYISSREEKHPNAKWENFLNNL